MAHEPNEVNGGDKPVPGDPAPAPAPKLFGGEHADKIFRLLVVVIGCLFAIPFLYLMRVVLFESQVVLNTTAFICLFLLFLGIALFLTLAAGEKYSVKVAGTTFAGSLGALAGLLTLFGHFNESIVGRRAPEYATLRFDCDFAEKAGQPLVMFVKGGPKYVSLVEDKVNHGTEKPFIRAGNSQIQPYTEHHVLLMNVGDKEFSIPVDFNLEHTLEIVPVPPAVVSQLRKGGPTSQPDAIIEKTSNKPLLIVEMDMMRSDSDAPKITAYFDLNVASSYCDPDKETIQASAQPQGALE